MVFRVDYFRIVDVLKGIEGAVEVVVIFGIALIIEKVGTVSHSNHFLKEFIPVDKNIVPFARESQPDPLSEYAVDDPDEITETVD